MKRDREAIANSLKLVRGEKTKKFFNAVWWVLLLLFSRSVTSDSLRPHGLQHASLLCPSLSPGVCSNSRPLNWGCHPAISSSTIPFSSWYSCDEYHCLIINTKYRIWSSQILTFYSLIHLFFDLEIKTWYQRMVCKDSIWSTVNILF